MKTKHIIYCIFGVLMFAACSGIDYEQQLERFEEMNRTDVPLCVDSVQPIVRHYDHWWHSRNHRMRAYYMLGCAYRDMGEAPAAIHYYNIATEKADTVHADSATYATLFRIYGQMAIIYEQQNMPKEEIETLNKLSKYASLAHDTLTSIMGEERKVVVYSQMDDTANVLRLTESVSQQYLKLGFAQKAARTFPTAIYVCLINKDFARARQYMDFFEKESGLFDEAGNIESGRELYYSFKGLYYLGTNKIDSAEYFYRKLSTTDYHYEANKGLFAIYQLEQNVDSVIKYASTTIDALIQWETKRQANAVIQSSAMYKYERNQNAAIRNADRASRLTKLLVIAVMLIVLLSVLYLYRNERRKREISELNRDLEISLNNLRETEEALEALKQEQDADHQLVADMQGDIDKYQLHIESLKSALQKRESSKTDRELSKSDIVKRFREARNGGANITPLTEEDWTKMADSIEEIYPQFHHVVNARGPLQTKEYRLCLLTKAQFSPSDIDVLMGQKPSYSTTIAKRLCQKVFGFDGSAADFRHSISLI